MLWYRVLIMIEAVRYKIFTIFFCEKKIENDSRYMSCNFYYCFLWKKKHRLCVCISSFQKYYTRPNAHGRQICYIYRFIPFETNNVLILWSSVRDINKSIICQNSRVLSILYSAVERTKWIKNTSRIIILEHCYFFNDIIVLRQKLDRYNIYV